MERNLEQSVDELGRIFQRISRLPLKESEFMSESKRADWEEKRILNGAKIFKRMVLGLCGRKTIKTNEELSNILYELGATEDIKEEICCWFINKGIIKRI